MGNGTIHGIGTTDRSRFQISNSRRSILKLGLGAAALAGSSSFLTSFSASASTEQPQEFKVAWSDESINSLRANIQGFEFPRVIPNSGWKYGVDPEYLRELAHYWVNDYDFVGSMELLNKHPQYIARVDGIDVHFIKVTGEDVGRKAKLPLLMTHGWPGSTYEFWKVIDQLAFPSRNGMKGDIAFDLIIPSLPGSGPSGKPGSPIGARTTARLWNKLMQENLGFQNYYAQGGDWGAGVTGWLSIDFPEAVKAIHLNLLIAAPEIDQASEVERTFLAEAKEHEERWGAYYQLQATEPQSLAYAINNNALAQAAWLVQRFYHWSDRREKSFADVFTMDDLLNNAMIHIMNDSFQTATWFYTAVMRKA